MYTLCRAADALALLSTFVVFLHFPDTLYSRRSTILPRFTAYHLPRVACPLFSSSRSAELLYPLLRSLSLSFYSLSTFVARGVAQFRSCQF